MYRPKLALIYMPVLIALAAAPAAHANGAVNVTLRDATDGSSVSQMEMTATPGSVKSGRITIHATNKSQGLVHEVIVVPAPSNGASLPYDAATGRVNEGRIADLGEVSDLAPGKSGSLTLNLKPGSYLLVCNQANHYKAGMWTRLTVTE